MHRARSKGIGRKFEHTSRELHLSRKKTKDLYQTKAAFMEDFMRRKKEEKKQAMEELEARRKRATGNEAVPVVHGSSSKPDAPKVDLKTCLSEPGEEILVKSLKSKSGGVVGKMEYSGKAFPVEKRKKTMMARKAELELIAERKLEKELMREEGEEQVGDGGDDDDDDVELPVFIGSMSKKKKKHNKKMSRRAYNK